MRKPVPDLTYKIVAYQFIQDVNWDEAIDWAYEMLLLGYDSPNLVMLAGITKSSDRFEVWPYLEPVLKEFGLFQIKEETALISYCSFLIKKVAIKNEIKLSLLKLSRVYLQLDMYWEIQDFYLLYWACEDLDYGMEYQYYWAGATKDNIKQIAVETAQNWLKQYENQLNAIITGQN